MQNDKTCPNVAPDPSIYWPSVLMIPLGPAPYLKILTVPETVSAWVAPKKRRLQIRTEDEADDHTDS